MGDPNKILDYANAYLSVSNLAGTAGLQQQLQGLPLGTSDGTATGQIVLKVAVVGTAGTAGGATVTTDSTAGTATASASSTLALATNSNRIYALLINTGANDAWLALGTDAVVGSGIYLKAGGGSYEITGANLYRGPINVITTSSTSNIATTEGI